MLQTIAYAQKIGAIESDYAHIIRAIEKNDLELSPNWVFCNPELIYNCLIRNVREREYEKYYPITDMTAFLAEFQKKAEADLHEMDRIWAVKRPL